jgi:hypothetical protein
MSLLTKSLRSASPEERKAAAGVHFVDFRFNLCYLMFRNWSSIGPRFLYGLELRLVTLCHKTDAFRLGMDYG